MPAGSEIITAPSPSPAIPLPVVHSVAAYLPAEILDSVFSHLDFDYDIDASQRSVTTRDGSLAACSRVAKPWLGPARRLLFRNISIRGLDDLLNAGGQKLLKRLRKCIKTLYIDFGGTPLTTQGKTFAANALFELLSKFSRLISLALVNVPFDRFSNQQSVELSSYKLLPNLKHLQLDSRYHLDPVLRDLLSTSRHQVTRLRYSTAGPPSAPYLRGRGAHDFGKRLRELSLDGVSVGRFLDDRMTDLESLEGLETLRLLSTGASMMAEGEETMDELFGIVAPTLKTLYLTSNLDSISPYLSTLPLLTCLDLDSHTASAPILHNLPPSLRRLRLRSDRGLRPILDDWMQHPSLAPDLDEIAIDSIRNPTILDYLGEVEHLTTRYSRELLSHLRSPIAIGTSGFLCDSVEVRFREKERHHVRAMWKVCEATGVELYVDIPEEKEAEEAEMDGGDSAREDDSDQSSCDEDPMEDDSAEAGLSRLLRITGHGQSSFRNRPNGCSISRRNSQREFSSLVILRKTLTGSSIALCRLISLFFA